jgi:hypothetical protein
MSQAIEISQIGDVPVVGDYVVGPGKYDLLISPGESMDRDVRITNRTGRVLKVKIEIEDFTGDDQVGTLLLGNEKGPYSLRDMILPDTKEFTLSHGERALLPVKISIPADAEPGGRYGSILVKVEPQDPDEKDLAPGAASGQLQITSRIAVMYFVRIKGDANEQGKLKGFTSEKSFYQKGPVKFSVLYENSGNVHLNPYGSIEIKNLLGKKVDEIEVSPYFVMPGFSRTMEKNWEKPLALGRYQATLKLNLGYKDIFEEKSVTFWIIPTKIIFIGLGAILLLSLIIVWFSSKFELKRK